MTDPESNATSALPGEITAVLQAWNAGDREAMARLVPMVYDRLRSAAVHFLQDESNQNTLQPTALINEVYIRLVETAPYALKNRLHFFWLAGTLMRRILVDDGRKRMSRKRGGGGVPITLNESINGARNVDPALLLALDEALDKLKAMDLRQGRIVEMKFFCGLSVVEIAQLLELSATTVKREWRIAKMWLARELRTAGKSSPG